MGDHLATMPRKNFGGGESSISFGGDGAPVAPALASGRAQFAAANQSSLIFDDSVPAPAATRTAGGGVSGSTCGNTIGSIPSVKVHHAPGGGSSICFGDDTSTPAPVVAAPVAALLSSPQPEDPSIGRSSNRTA